MNVVETSKLFVTGDHLTEHHKRTMIKYILVFFNVLFIKSVIHTLVTIFSNWCILFGCCVTFYFSHRKECYLILTSVTFLCIKYHYSSDNAKGITFIKIINFNTLR